MKAVLLHGGYGTRLRPLTNTIPKQLLQVAGKPVSQYCIETLRDGGITEIAVVLGPVGGEKVRRRYDNGARLGVKLHYLHQDTPSGIAHAIGLAEDFVAGEKFAVHLGDNLLCSPLGHLSTEFAKGTADVLLLLSKVAEPRNFGFAVMSHNGRVVRLYEKPQIPPSDLAIVGIYFFTPTIFESIRNLAPGPRSELEITDAIQAVLANQGKVEHRILDTWWKDIGTPNDLLEANRHVLGKELAACGGENAGVEEGAIVRGNVRVEKGAVVRSGAVVVGPSHIGAGSVIEEGTQIGPYTSVGDHCRLASCSVEDSIVMDDVAISGKRHISRRIVSVECELSSET